MSIRERIIRGIFLMCCLAMLMANLAPADEAKPPDTRGRDLLAKKLATLQDADKGRVEQVTAEYLSRALPDHLFYMLRFGTYPTAQPLSPPLRARNLFIVKPDDSVEHIVDRSVLETFFRSTLVLVTTEAQARDAAKAWLRFILEFHQDGYYRFAIPEESVLVSATSRGREVTAKAEITAGGWGELVIHLAFDQAGKVVEVSGLTDYRHLRRGLRPICQATKLLDPDPIVRAMAEQAILIMGRHAKEYLDDQRARARPELQRAIDQMWRRILAEDP
jgi:hypothetical protein